jgi:outer membrane protein assembly factor BamB
MERDSRTSLFPVTYRASRAASAAIVCLIAILGAVFACGQPSRPEAVGMFRGGPEHRGLYPAAPADGRGVIEWSFQTAGPVRASVLVDSARIYVGSGDGNFYAIDRRTGEERWRYQAGGPIQSSAAAWGDLVFFGDRSNTVYALERSTGRERWRVETGGDHPFEWGLEGWDYFTSSPVIAGDRVVVGSGDGNVYALDAATGQERWRVETGGRVRSSPAIGDGVVFVGSADGVLYAIDLETGELEWRFETEGASYSSAEFGFDRKTIQSSPALTAGAVFFGSRDGKFYAVEAVSGEQRWRYDHSTPWVVASAAIGDNLAIVGTSDGLFVHAIDIETGEEVWRFETGDRVFSSPALSGSTVYVGVHDGRLLALDAGSGALHWALNFGGAVMSSPVIDAGRIYVGCDDGSVYSIRLENGPPPRRAVFWDEERVGWNTLASHEHVRDHFASFGYEIVDRFQLSEFMETSNRGDVSSVVVFAMDHLPETVAAVPSDTVLARRYLDAGGKIVWLGLPPLAIARDEEGRPTSFSREPAQALLGVSFGRYNADQYGAYPTPEGKRWGFSDWWVSSTGVEAAEVTTVLARDDDGGAVAWAKDFGGPPGSGFVMLWGTYRPVPVAYLEQVRRVAEYGIGVAASAAE